MLFEPRLDIFALFMLLGLSQGIFLIFFFLLKRQRQRRDNLFFAFMLITFTILLSEILLNYTGLIVKVISIENYSESFIFLPMPLLYLIIRMRLKQDYSREDHVHFFPFIFYFLYCFLYFFQPDAFKYNSFVYCYHPEWSYLDVHIKFSDDPLMLRQALAALYISQALIYLYLILVLILNLRKKKREEELPPETARQLKVVTQYWIHALIITLLIIYVKIAFERDLGDYIIGTYISLVLYIAGFVTLAQQYNTKHIDEQQPEVIKPKYEKSSLTQEKKSEILGKLVHLFEQEKYFTRNMISLAMTAKAIGEPSHHVSQVINENLNKSFFDLLSEYRVEEAKKILSSSVNDNLTIEEVAEQVGYNSKAAFNKAFKTITGLTPSEFRKTCF